MLKHLSLKTIANARKAGISESVLQIEDDRIGALNSGNIPAPAAKKTTKKHVERSHVEDVETVEDDGDSDPDDEDEEKDCPGDDDEEAAAADRERAYAASFGAAARRGAIPCTFRRS